MNRAALAWLLLVFSCAHAEPLPVPPSDADYCATSHVMPLADWRALCGQYPRQLAGFDGGAQ